MGVPTENMGKLRQKKKKYWGGVRYGGPREQRVKGAAQQKGYVMGHDGCKYAAVAKQVAGEELRKVMKTLWGPENHKKGPQGCCWGRKKRGEGTEKPGAEVDKARGPRNPPQQ